MAPADVDRDTRDRAKAVNFGIVYGISDFGLSENLGISRADARLYIDAYLARYPRVRSFIDTTIAAAAQDGYVTTLFGRRRAIPELQGRTLQQRQLGERLAVNTVIQGTAADIIKAAMIRRPRGPARGGPPRPADPADPRRAAGRGAGGGGPARRPGGAPGDGLRLPARPAPGGRRGDRRHVAGGEVTEAEAYRVLEVHPSARPEVVRAAFGILREICLREEGDDAPRRLAELNRAAADGHRACGGPLGVGSPAGGVPWGPTRTRTAGGSRTRRGSGPSRPRSIEWERPPGTHPRLVGGAHPPLVRRRAPQHVPQRPRPARARRPRRPARADPRQRRSPGRSRAAPTPSCATRSPASRGACGAWAWGRATGS